MCCCMCHRYRHEIAHDGQRIYILGGGTSWTSYPLDKVLQYYLLTKRILINHASHTSKFEMFHGCLFERLSFIFHDS